MSLGISPGQLSNHEVEREGRREAAALWLHTWLGSRHRAVHGSRCSCLAAGCTEPLHITAGWSEPSVHCSRAKPPMHCHGAAQSCQASCRQPPSSEQREAMCWEQPGWMVVWQCLWPPHPCSICCLTPSFPPRCDATSGSWNAVGGIKSQPRDEPHSPEQCVGSPTCSPAAPSAPKAAFLGSSEQREERMQHTSHSQGRTGGMGTELAGG